MRITILFAIAAAALLVTQPASAIEFQYTGAPEKLKEASAWCAGEAQKMISARAIDTKFTNALYNALMLEKLKSDGGFQGTKCNDAEINEIGELGDALWKVPSETLDKFQHKFLNATIGSFKVRAVKQRAKDLFGNDGPENWRIPKEKEDPKRFYTVER